MFITYVLRSRKDQKLYIGHTRDLKIRLNLHNAGKVKSTKPRLPFDLIYFREFQTKSEARWQERKWKSAAGHVELKKILSST